MKKFIWVAVGFLILFAIWLTLKIRAAKRLTFSLNKIPKRFKVTTDFIEWSHTVAISNIDSIGININGAAINVTINKVFAGQVFLEKEYKIKANQITNIDFRVRCSIDDFIAVVIGEQLDRTSGNFLSRVWQAIRSLSGKEISTKFDGTLYAEGFGLPYNETFVLKIPNVI